MSTARTRLRAATRIAAATAAMALGLTGVATPAYANGVITFVAYFDDAAHSNLVGSSTFSECPGDPSYHWGAYTSFYEISTEACP